MKSLRKINGYDVLNTLGTGAASTIYAVQDSKTNQIYALKQVLKKAADDQKFIDQAINEHNIASRIDHPAVRKCFKLKKVRKLIAVSEINLLMELVDGHNIQQKRHESLTQLARIFIAAADAIHAIHEAGFVHADIKPINILFTDQHSVKIIDFGHSCPIGTVKDRVQGTPDYIAPEQVRRQPITERTDIFSFGASLYWCVTNKFIPTLIPKTDNGVTRKDSTTLIPPIEIKPEIPLSLNTLILECIRDLPEERPESMPAIKARLELILTQLQRAKAVESTK